MFNQKVNDTTFVVFDIETTGFSPQDDQIIEIGAVKINAAGEKLSSFSKFVSLYKVKTLPEKIVELTTITDQELVEKGEPIDEVMNSFFEYIEGSVLVAQNAKFDMSFLAAYQLTTSQQSFSRVCFDTIFFGKILRPDETSYKLSSLVDMFEVDYDKDAHHRADYDAEITANVLVKQFEQLALSPDVTIYELIQLENAPKITEKQEAFLSRLLTEKGIGLNESDYFNKATASTHIDLLTKL